MPKQSLSSRFQDRFHESLSETWRQLFSSAVHLDAALSKAPADIKPFIAELLPVILRRPVALSQEMGLPDKVTRALWALSPEEIRDWAGLRVLGREFLEVCRLDAGPDLERARVADAAKGVLRNSAKRAGPSDFSDSWFESWIREWGEKKAVHLCTVLAGDPPLSVRASQRIGREKLLNAFGTQLELPKGTKASSLVPTGVDFPTYIPLLGTSLASDGLFEIQDSGSQFMAHFTLWPEDFGTALADEPGSANRVDVLVPRGRFQPRVVVDACAGAGGKTLAIADLMEGRGRVFAYDVSERKLQALRRRATKARLNSVQTLALEEGREISRLDRFKGTADIVLVDAPCSGFGILRRSPDIKWKAAPSDFDHLPSLQLRLLELYAGLVAPGGRLLYGLCTFSKKESAEVVGSFLKKNVEFMAGHGGYVGPQEGASDGFFMQELRRAEK